MKRGKNEKILEPMFPRLHVNDTDNTGPRAPPRNKMALYEQLCHTSKNFDLSTNEVTQLDPPSNQGIENEQRMSLSYQLPARSHSEKLHGQYSGCGIPSAQVNQRKKLNDLLHSLQNQECGIYANDQHREGLSPSKPSNFSQPLGFQRYTKMSSIRQDVNCQKDENSKEFATDQVKDTSLSTNEQAVGEKKQPDSSVCRESRDGSSIDRLEVCDTVEPDPCAGSLHNLGESIVAPDQTNSPAPVRACSSEKQACSRDLRNDPESQDKSCRSVHTRNPEMGYSISENPVVDPFSGFDLSPDDVVGLIGQKRFWKARKVILNQQRVFAVQVFELHRLIKVQKSIAESPQGFVDHSARLGKSTEASPSDRIPLNYPVMAIPNAPAPKPKAALQKLYQKKGKSTENTSIRPSSSCARPPSYQSLNRSSGTPFVSSHQMARQWCLDQSKGQWLIAVMSPSEGLVYKPVPGPPGPNPLPSNLLQPAGEIPAPHPPHDLPSYPPYGYHPTYSPQVMNGPSFSGSSVEQYPPPIIPCQPSSSVQHQNSSPSHWSLDGTSMLPVFKDVGSSASSRIRRVQDSSGREETAPITELPLFPTSPTGDTRCPIPPRANQDCPIKAVPHNATSATESAARIFLSIQEERKQLELA